jgi:hypothetical protein
MSSKSKSISDLGYDPIVNADRFRSQMPTVMLLSGLLAATIALLEPFKSAVSNWNEIGISFAFLLSKLAIPFGLIFCSIAALATVLAAIAPRRAIPILLALYVGLWAQGNLFIWSYGSFDGSPIDWAQNNPKGLIEVTFWAVALAVAITLPRWFRSRALWISVAVLVLQLTALGDQIRKNAPFPELSSHDVEVPHAQGSTHLSLIQSANRFSSDLNVIIIVLDSLQSDYFSEALRSPELLAAIPPGFTYYRNAVSLYELTEFSLQSMLTSRAIPDYVHLRKWRDEQIPLTMPARLTEHGFDAVLTTFSQAHYRDFGGWKYPRVLSASLAESGAASEVWREDVSNLFAIGLFRLSPHFLKPRIYNDGSWKLRRLYMSRDAISQDSRIQFETRTDLAVFDELTASASVEDVGPRFRFFHFYGAHRPYTVSEDCSYQRGEVFRPDVVATTHCMMLRLSTFLHKLDELGAYDQSLIFVVADHGEHYVRLKHSVASPKLPADESRPNPTDRNNPKRIKRYWQGVPLFLYKPIGDRKPFRISDQPVSLCDIPRTVFETLEFEHDYGCDSIASDEPVRQTPRIHYRYPTRVEERVALGLTHEDGLPFEKFEVIGHSWWRNSWIPYERGADESPAADRP